MPRNALKDKDHDQELIFNAKDYEQIKRIESFYITKKEK